MQNWFFVYSRKNNHSNVTPAKSAPSIGVIGILEVSVVPLAPCAEATPCLTSTMTATEFKPGFVKSRLSFTMWMCCYRSLWAVDWLSRLAQDLRPFVSIWQVAIRVRFLDPFLDFCFFDRRFDGAKRPSVFSLQQQPIFRPRPAWMRFENWERICFFVVLREIPCDRLLSSMHHLRDRNRHETASGHSLRVPRTMLRASLVN